VLLAAAQAADVMTSAVDMARGTVESTAATARHLDRGRLALILIANLLVAGAAAAVLGLAALRIRHGARGAHISSTPTTPPALGRTPDRVDRAGR
jgi:hypothetical protein